MAHIRLRPVAESDLAAVLAINEQSVPHVNSVSLDTMRRFASCAGYFRVATVDEAVVGFLIGLTRDTPYDSPNFLTFRRWFPEFVYVDRIAVAQSARVGGVGRALYDDVERFATALAPLLTCEVNLRPPDPDSLAFHRRMGFSQVGTQQTDGGRKTVALLMKRVGDSRDRRRTPFALADPARSLRSSRRGGLPPRDTCGETAIGCSQGDSRENH